MREGAKTAVSHGLWLNIPDYDAPTQLVKPLERNTRYKRFRPLDCSNNATWTVTIDVYHYLNCTLLVRYVDAVLTIPKGTLFPMCGMNLAFDRELIGPAMYFDLMGDGQPIGRYDDMWAGWCTKVFHLLVFTSQFESLIAVTLVPWFWISSVWILDV